jgi:hypothetical protein
VKVGILSDTHDRAQAMMKGVAALKEAGAEFFIHCGDVGSPGMLDELAGLRAGFVWGNNDLDRVELQRYAESLGIICWGDYGVVELAGKRIGVMHGDNFALHRKVLAEQQIDYLLEGHTHVRADEKFGTIRMINPGALYRAAQKTVAVLDLATGELKFIVVQV